jgi:hypothetical protein
MTLIALTVNNIQNGKHGYPVLMGDLLISSPDGDENMPTPTYVNGTREIYADADDKPIGLNQKLYVINDRLCVALGGRVSQMETFLKKLRVIYDTVDFDINDLSKFVNEFAKEEGDEMFAIILIASEIEKDTYDFQVRCINLFQNDMAQSSLYGTVVAGGSGADQFLKFVQTNTKFATDITNTDAFLATNQSLMSHFLGLEISSADTLREYWGAGFEMITFDSGKFVKLHEYTVVVLNAPFGRGKMFEAEPICTMMINYQDDVMLITTFTEGVERVFAVPSITDKRRSIDVMDFEPKDNALLLSYIFKDTDNVDAKYYRSAIFPRNTFEFGKSPIVFERADNGKLQIYKDGRQDIPILRTVLHELGFELHLTEVG